MNLIDPIDLISDIIALRFSKKIWRILGIINFEFSLSIQYSLTNFRLLEKTLMFFILYKIWYIDYLIVLV